MKKFLQTKLPMLCMVWGNVRDRVTALGERYQNSMRHIRKLCSDATHEDTVFPAFGDSTFVLFFTSAKFWLAFFQLLRLKAAVWIETIGELLLFCVASLGLPVRNFLRIGASSTYNGFMLTGGAAVTILGFNTDGLPTVLAALSAVFLPVREIVANISHTDRIYPYWPSVAEDAASPALHAFLIAFLAVSALQILLTGLISGTGHPNKSRGFFWPLYFVKNPKPKATKWILLEMAIVCAIAAIACFLFGDARFGAYLFIAAVAHGLPELRDEIWRGREIRHR